MRVLQTLCRKDGPASGPTDGFKYLFFHESQRFIALFGS